MVIAVRNLDASSEAFRRLGFSCTRGGRHTGRGTGALRTRLELSGFHVDLFQPSAPGPALSALEREGEGLFQIDLAVSDLARAAAITQATPAGPDIALVSSGAGGVQLMLVPDESKHAD